jgi:hypothetical protein
LVFILIWPLETADVNGDVNQMATQEIEQQITELEMAYGEALIKHADIHALSLIWRRIKELKEELKKRK